MKHKTIVLVGLLVLANAGLWAAYFRRADAASRAPAPAVETPPLAPSPPAAPTATPAVAVPAKLWSQLQCDDPVRFAANLRGAGAPEATVRLLVSAQLRGSYLVRQRELFGPGDAGAVRQALSTPENRVKQTELHQLARAQQEVLRGLFGGDEYEQALRERQRREFGPLSDEKLDQVDGIQTDYDEMAAEIRRKAGGLLLPAEREALDLLEQEKRKDIAEILTPAELEQLDLNTSPAALALRNRLAGFVPTDREFRAIFTLQRAFDEKFGPGRGGFDGAGAPGRAAAEQELENKLRTALGETRFAEYRKQQDNGFRLAARIVERLGLPAQRAAEVYTLAQDAQLRLQILRTDRTLTPEAALQSLVTLDRDINERLGALLGAEGVEAYRQTSGGAWLRTMDRLVANVPPPAPVGPIAPAALPVGAAPVSTANTPATLPSGGL